jgi:hypothetical protein
LNFGCYTFEPVIPNVVAIGADYGFRSQLGRREPSSPSPGSLPSVSYEAILVNSHMGGYGRLEPD